MEKTLLLISILLNIGLIYKKILIVLKKIIKKILCAFGFYHYPQAKLSNQAIVYHAHHMDITYLETNNGAGATLPQQFIIPPNHYQFDGQCYDLSKEGLYRFIVPLKMNCQRIVYKNNVHLLLSALAWCVSHGEEDDSLSYAELLNKISQNKLQLTCEPIANFACTLLTQLHIPVRVLGTRTLEMFNGYDDGHYFIEVFRTDIQKWVMYDVDMDVWFSSKGQPLSALEFIDCLPRDDYEIHYLSADLRALSSISTQSNYDHSFLIEARLNNLRAWYKRMMQIVFIQNAHTNYTYHMLTDEIKKLFPRGAFPQLNYLPRTAFISQFYQ